MTGPFLLTHSPGVEESIPSSIDKGNMPLELTNLPLTGLQIEQRAVFEAGANVGTGNSNIFLSPPRGTSGSVEDGDITLETTEITRVRILNGGAGLSVNDSNQPDALNLSFYFGTGGIGRDLTLYFVTALGTFSLPVENTDGTDGYFSTAGDGIRFDIPTTTLEPGNGFGFDSAGVGFDQRRFLPNPYSAQDVLRGIRTGDRFILAFARPIPRHAITAAITLGAPSTTAEVSTRTPTRHEVEASGTLPIASTTVAVQVRASSRHPITAATTLTAPTSTTVVQLRAIARHSIMAATTLTSPTSTTTVRVRASSRHSITAVATLPAPTTTTTVQLRAIVRHSVMAEATLPAPTTTTAVQVRASLRHSVMAATTLPVPTTTTTVQLRAIVRHSVVAASTLGRHHHVLHGAGAGTYTACGHGYAHSGCSRYNRRGGGTHYHTARVDGWRHTTHRQ